MKAIPSWFFAAMMNARLTIPLFAFALFSLNADCCWGTNIVAVGRDGEVRQTSDGGANWFIRSAGTSDLYDLQCLGSSCWAVGVNGEIRKTIDAGITWSPLNSGTTTTFHDVYFLNKQRGWAVGNSDKIFTTSNGGMTWTPASVPGAPSSFRGVHFVDPQTGWLVGSSGMIRRTIDGGQNWSFQTSGTSDTIYDVQFLDTNNGFYVGSGKVGRTINGGSMWTDVTPPTVAGREVKSLHFLDPLHGFIVGSSGLAYKTDNGGDNWMELDIGLGNIPIEDISMLTPSVGAIAALNGSGGLSNLGYVRTTADGGGMWTPETIGPTGFLFAVAMFDVPLPGDYNLDGGVGAADYQKWRDNFGSQSAPDADGNDNGIVDAADYVIWRNALPVFGSGTTTSIPEPATGLLLFLASLLIPGRRLR